MLLGIMVGIAAAVAGLLLLLLVAVLRFGRTPPAPNLITPP
jgi:hypothetical protein